MRIKLFRRLRCLLALMELRKTLNDIRHAGSVGAVATILLDSNYGVDRFASFIGWKLRKPGILHVDILRAVSQYTRTVLLVEECAKIRKRYGIKVKYHGGV